MTLVKVATRGSLLALTQTNWVVEQLKRIHPELLFETSIFKTVGDQRLDVSLSQIGGKGLFTKELEDALLGGEADLAVHSLKDMPTELPKGLALAAIPVRADARDVVITAGGERFLDLPTGTLVGTSSLRRLAQLRVHRSDLQYVSIRGNIDTRLRKLREGQVGAVVMAAAGFHRVGLGDQITEYLDPAFCLPAAGQGALTIEIRSGDNQIQPLVAAIHHEPTAMTVRAERALLARLQGGCQVPIAAHAVLDRGHIILKGLIASTDGTQVVQYQAEAAEQESMALGERVADWLFAHGGEAILAEVRATAKRGDQI